MTDTPNHEYNVPTQGTQDWHVPLNENFRAFEVDIELRDAESNLSAYAPQAGAKFLATDTGVVYLGDGSTWVATAILPGYDASSDVVGFGQTVAAPTFDARAITGSLTDGVSLTTIAGANLSIDGNGQLNATDESGVTFLTGGAGIEPGTIGDGDTLSVAWADANDLDADGNVTGEWTVANALLEPTDSGVDGIDVDEVNTELLAASGPLTLAVGGTRALELTGETGGLPGNVVAGHSANAADPGLDGATIAGGGPNDSQAQDATNNAVYDHYGTVGGGAVNRAGDPDGDPTTTQYATVGGGLKNTANGQAAVVGGGENNAANGRISTVGGGLNNEATEKFTTVAGGYNNDATGAYAAIIGGQNNRALAAYATVSGGGPSDPLTNPYSTNNAVYDEYGTVSGGADNKAGDLGSDMQSAPYATVSGGLENRARGEAATVGGGAENEATETYAAVGGGYINRAKARAAAVPGGENSVADGQYSLAAGREAKTDGNDGAFVWGDSSAQEVRSGGVDEFKIQAGGGAVFYSSSDFSTGAVLAAGDGTWSSISSRTAKTDVDPVSPTEVLEKVERLDVARWEYDSDNDAEHMGPMAEDFHDAFGLGVDERHIANVDADGVALAAIQALSAALDEREERVAALEAENDALKKRLDALENRLDDLTAAPEEEP